VTITKQPYLQQKRFSIRIKTIRQKSAVSYYLNKGDKIYTDEIVKKVGLPCFVKPNKAGSSFEFQGENEAEPDCHRSSLYGR
jgi:D-alanine-D-alanine ligase-like ATP-grasp enzyme